MPKSIELKLSNAEFIILAEIIVKVTRSMRYDKTDQCYYDNGDFLLKCDKKEITALRAIARKIGVK